MNSSRLGMRVLGNSSGLGCALRCHDYGSLQSLSKFSCRLRRNVGLRSHLESRVRPRVQQPTQFIGPTFAENRKIVVSLRILARNQQGQGRIAMPQVVRSVNRSPHYICGSTSHVILELVLTTNPTQALENPRTEIYLSGVSNGYQAHWSHAVLVNGINWITPKNLARRGIVMPPPLARWTLQFTKCLGTS